MKKYGLKFDKRDKNAYVLGAGSLPEIVLCEDGQWDNYLPTYEPQAENFESYGCTVWGTQNAIEMIIRRLTNVERNFSERYNYILADIVPPGADPHYVIESIRKYGLVDQSILPMASTLKEFKTPKPMTQALLEKGAEFPYEVRHEYLWSGNPKNKAELIKKALRLSPIGVSVTAWNEENGVYVDKGRSNNHWCVLYGWNTRGWKIFDSYDHSMKVLSFDHNIQIAKRFVLIASTRNRQISLIERIVKLLEIWRGLVQTSNVEAKPIESPVLPQPEPIKSRLIEWAEAIRDFEGNPGDLNYRNNNPGNLRSARGPFIKFKTWEEGWKALLDYLTRASTGKHKAYPKAGETTLLQFFKIYAPSTDGNHPEVYAKYVAKRLNVDTSVKIKDLL